MDFALVREEAHAVAFALLRLRRDALAGRGGAPSTVLRAHPLLVTDDARSLVAEALAASEGRRRQRLGHLAHAIAGWTADARIGTLLDDAELRPGTVAGVTAGSSLTLAEADHALASLTHRETRAALESRLAFAAEPLHRAILRRIDSAQGLLPFPDAVADEATRFLAATDAMYGDVVAWWLRRSTELRTFPHGAARHDLEYALWGNTFDGLFRASDVLRLPGSFEGAGLSRRVTLDDAPREGRAPGAMTVGLDPPAKVVVLHVPRGGARDARELLRAFGEAVHLASIAADRPPEDRILGARAPIVATGHLLASCLLDRRFLKKRLDAEAPDLTRVLALGALAEARREAAALIAHQRMRRAGGTAGALEEGAELLSRALGAAVPQRLVPLWFEAPAEAGRAFEGLLLGAALREHVRDRCDEDWWANPRTGPLLSTLCASGGFEMPASFARPHELPEATGERLARGFEALIGA